MRAILLVMAVAASAVTLAQDSFDFYVAQMEILQDRAVQSHLGVTERQRTKMNAHADWFNAQSEAIRKKHGETPTEAGMKEMETLHGQLKKRVFGELTGNQLRRLREISLQQGGPMALLDETIAQRCGVSGSTLQKLRTGFESNSKKAGELEEKTLKPIFDKYQQKAMAGDTAAQQALEREVNAARQKIAPEMSKLQGEFLKLMDENLNDEQKARFAALQGEPYVP